MPIEDGALYPRSEFRSLPKRDRYRDTDARYINAESVISAPRSRMRLVANSTPNTPAAGRLSPLISLRFFTPLSRPD